MKVQSFASPERLSRLMAFFVNGTHLLCCAAAARLLITWKSTSSFFGLDEISTSFFCFFFRRRSNIFSIFLLSHLSASPPWFVSPPSSPRTASPVDWAFLILAVKKPFKVDERWKESITSFFPSRALPDRCLSESRWARVEIKYKITNSRVHCIIRVWADGNQADFCRLHSFAAQWTEPRTQSASIVESWTIIEFEASAKGRQRSDTKTKSHRTHIVSARSIKLKQIVLVKCRGKSATFSILFRVVVVSIALDVIVTIGRLSAASLHYTLTIQYFLCAYWLDLYIFIFPPLRLRPLLLFTCLVST